MSDEAVTKLLGTFTEKQRLAILLIVAYFIKEMSDKPVVESIPLKYPIDYSKVF